MSKRKTPWLENPFRFKTFFEYATGLPRRASGKGGKQPGKDKEKDKGTVTTMVVGEEGTGTPPQPPGKTTPAIGEEGAGDVPTTTIPKGEEAG